MNLKNLTPAETILAIKSALKTHQSFNLFKRNIFEANAPTKVITKKLETALSIQTEQLSLVVGSPEFVFCQSFIRKINERQSEFLDLREYLIILAVLLENKTPLQIVNNYLSGESWSCGERIIIAFERKNISSALDVFRIRFWDDVDNLAKVKRLYYDALVELVENSPEWNFCQSMIITLHNWKGNMSFQRYVEIILRITGWARSPANCADDYVNGDARRAAALIKFRMACAVLSAYK